MANVDREERGARAQGAVEEGDLVDYRRLGQWAGFVLHAAGRHRRLVAACFLGVVGLAAVALAVLPKRWEVQTTILAQRNPLNVGLYRDWDAPTRAARETVLRRENLSTLVQQTDFQERYLASRSPAVRARDWAFALLRGRERTHDELLESLVDGLEDRLWVLVGSEGTITIGFEWSDRELAYDLVEAALQNFLEARHAAEVSSIAENISLLEEHASRLQESIAGKTREVEEMEREARARGGRRVAYRPRVPRDEDLARLETRLQARRKALEDLEEYRQRRIAELQATLTQQETMYAERHPVLVATRKSIEALTDRSPQVDAIRAEITDLEREVTRRGARPQDPTRPGAGPMESDGAGPELRLEQDAPQLEYERHKLWLLVRQHSGLLDRIDQARVELNTAQAGFKYRYSVVTPPQLPKAPKSPRASRIAAMALVGGIAFALFAAAAADLRGGVVLERWQLEGRLDPPVLAETRAPRG